MLIGVVFRYLLLIFLLSACQNTQQEKVEKINLAQAPFSYDKDQFELLVVPSIEDIFTLTEKQKNEFLRYYYAPHNSTVAGHKRLYNYLEGMISGFDFRGKTYTATQTLQNMSGNCLSLAILTTSLADLVGIEKSYQRVNSAPVYTQYDNVMTLSYHVQTHLYDPDFVKQEGFIYVSRPKIVIDYFPLSGNVRGDEVSEVDFISMFYQNLAGDELVKGNYNSAYSLIIQALEISLLNANSLNTLAVLFKNVNRADQAEAIYDFAIQHANGSVNTISNYILLLEQQSRMAEAELLAARLDKVVDDNPYRWLYIANTQFSRAEFKRALGLYKRVTDEAPYLHEGYFGLAKSYYQLGKLQKADLAMKKALELSFLPDDQNLYQAKLRILEGM